MSWSKIRSSFINDMHAVYASYKTLLFTVGKKSPRVFVFRQNAIVHFETKRITYQVTKQPYYNIKGRQCPGKFTIVRNRFPSIMR